MFLDGDASTLLPLIRERRAEYQHAADEGAAVRVRRLRRRAGHVAGARCGARSSTSRPATSCAGSPVAPASAEGRARVILDPNDPVALGPGDVLVAPITDPSWTPLFVPAAAVVVDVGAALSHAIIVSRELGIPCVVSATDATRRIPDGALVRVDGGTGVVTVVEV